MKFGIDISKWQGNFDLGEAVKDGVTFVIVKGGGGDDGLYVDSKFERNYSLAKSLKIPTGCYWFSKAQSVADAVREADFFYENILRGKKFELPIFIDVEQAAMLSIGKDKLTETVAAWCSRLEDKGFWVGVYSTVYAFSAYMNDSKLTRYTHWVAQWAEKCTYPNLDALGFWQFGGETNLIRSNAIAGVVCDQNYMYKDFPALIKAKGLNGYSNDDDNDVPAMSPADPPLKSVEEVAKEVVRGEWGVGEERKKRLTEAGYDYDEVQSLVNRALSPSAPAPDKNAIRAGDMATIANGAPIYGTDKQFASFVYGRPLYVREINGNRAVISTEPTGPVTGAADIKYLTKYRT